jgi:transporter family-2 protein
LPQPTTFWTLAALLFATGLGIPVLATLNGQLGLRLASPFGATCIAFAVGFALSAALLLITPPVQWSGIPNDKPWLLFGVVFMVFYITSITYAAPRIGIGNAIFFVLIGQIVAAAIIDHFGLFGAIKYGMTGRRAVGMGVMALGVYLARRGG